MAPNKPNLRQLAEQGNPEAIAKIFNQFFQRKGLQDVEATAERTDGWLYITLQAPQVPNQEVFVKTIRQGMERIGCNEIHTVQVEGYQSGSDTPGWSEQIQLQSADLSVFEQYNPESETEEAAASASAVADPSPEDFPEEQTEQEDQEYASSWEEESSFPADTGDTEPAVRKRRRGFLPIVGILLLLVVVGTVALVYYVRLIPGWNWPEKWPRPVALDLSHVFGKGESSKQTDSSTPTSTSQPPTSSPSPEATEEAKPESSPEASPSPDPWREGVNKAIEAAELAQNANSQSEWNQVQKLWQQAANAMAEVPQDHPKYETAQQKVNEYQQNAEVASQRAAQAGS
jgi:chemotaxis protein histidine kinase CheA